jgi:hypothetical protein
MNQAGRTGPFPFFLKGISMTTINHSMMSKHMYQGPFGNLSKSGFTYTFKANPIGDVVNGRQLPAGACITGVEYINDALGSGVTIDIKAGSNVLVSALACAAAGSGYRPVADTMITDDFTPLSIVAGGAAATGKVTIRVLYDMIGTL